MKKKFILLFIGIFTLALGLFCVSCGKSNDGGENQNSETSEEIIIPSIEFSDKRVEMIFGESRQLTLVGLNDGETAQFHSNDTSIVTVDGEGLLQSTGVGTTVVKATTSEGRSALVQIVVHDPEYYPVPYITVEKESVTLSVGDTFTLSYACYYLGQELNLSVVAESENDQVASVENGVITAVGVGSTDILLHADSSYGEARMSLKVTVLEKQTEFYLSAMGTSLYAGQPIDLAAYVNENGKLTVIDNATFSVENSEIAFVEGSVLTPRMGGDTTLFAAFEYENKSYTESLSIHVYGYHSCTFTFMDGTVDHAVEALYGDTVAIALENADGNPEYRKEIKQWLVNGEECKDGFIKMPDEDVEVTVCFVNETKDDFTGSFTDGHLLGDGAAIAQYYNEPFVDSQGVSSDSNGYVKFYTNWLSLNYNFDEVVTVNDFSTVKMKVFVPEDLLLIYFGVATDVKFAEQENPRFLVKPTKRYESGNVANKTGDVPFAVIERGKWEIIELPLNAFVESGEKISGISISISNTYLYIDWISVNYGLSATDPVYQDNILCKAIEAEANGSDAQIEAITTYRNWAKGLTAEEKASDTHQANIAKINALIDLYYQDPITTSSNNRHYAQGNSGTACSFNGEVQSTNTKYNSRAYNTFYKSTISGAPHDITLSFDAFNFNAYEEVSFGMFLIMDNVYNADGSYKDWAYATISVGGVSCEKFDSKVAYYYKAVVKDGKFTLYSDEQGQASAKVILEAALSADVLNGWDMLKIDLNLESYAVVETTEWYSTMVMSHLD